MQRYTNIFYGPTGSTMYHLHCDPNGTFVTYADAEREKAEARKQGAEEERQRIEKAYNDARHDYMPQDAWQIAIKARGATEPPVHGYERKPPEPKCCCYHAPPTCYFCPIHGSSKPTEMKCTCPNDWNPHEPGCPFYMPTPLSHNFDPDSFHDAVDAIYEIRAEIAKLRGRV